MARPPITRSPSGGARPAEDFPAPAAAYLDGRLDLDGLITARFGLAAINEGCSALTRGAATRRVVVVP